MGKRKLHTNSGEGPKVDPEKRYVVVRADNPKVLKYQAIPGRTIQGYDEEHAQIMAIKAHSEAPIYKVMKLADYLELIAEPVEA